MPARLRNCDGLDELHEVALSISGPVTAARLDGKLCFGEKSILHIHSYPLESVYATCFIVRLQELKEWGC